MRAPLEWALLVACVCAVAGEGAAPSAAAPKLTPSQDAVKATKAAPQMEQWQFRWDKTSPVQGPYPTAQMVKYAKQGYFAQSNEPALVHLLGQKEGSWVPYDTIDFVAYADFMGQAALRAADRVRQASALVERMDESDRDALLKVMEKTDDMQTRLMESADRTPLHAKLGEALLGDSDSNSPEFVTAGVVTSSTRDSSPPTCVVAPARVAPAKWMPGAVAGAGYACPEGQAIVAHINQQESPVVRLTGKAADDSAESARWWVEHDKRQMVEQENMHLRKHMMPSPQEMELGESASTTAGATEMAMARFASSLRDLNSDVTTVAKKYRHKLTGQRLLEHPIVKKQIEKCEVDPEYDQNLGESGDLELAKLVLHTTLKQHDWNHKRMMSRATEILTHARLATEVAVSTAAQRYNRQMLMINKQKKQTDVKELGESAGMADDETEKAQARAQMTAMEGAAMGSLKRIKDEGFQVIRSIFNQMKRPDDKMISNMACDLMAELKTNRATRRNTLNKKTKLQPYRMLVLPTYGEMPGGGKLTCSDTNPAAGDTKGYGYAGGNNCGTLKAQVVTEGQASDMVKAANNNTVTLFRDVLESEVWNDPNLRWSQPSPKDHTMTKASYQLLGDKIGMTSPRADELEKRVYNHQWLSTCPKTCRSCQSGKPGDDCYHSNLHRNYPLPWNGMIASKHNSFDSLIRSSPVVSGAAILNLDDSGTVSSAWPYGWKKHIMRESVSKGAFWNSNTAVGPYVRCGVCKTTTCISNAKGYKFTYYNRKNTNRMCSAAELRKQRKEAAGKVESAGDGQDLVDGVSAQHLLQNMALKKLQQTECVAQESTSQYCTTKARAECMYVQYCQRGDWNCDSQSGWSDPIYDCSKVVSSTGITGDEWCAQLAL